MIDFGTVLYFTAIVAGTLILGVTIAYAFIRFSKRTKAERRASDQASRRLYREEDAARASEERAAGERSPRA